MLHLPSALLHTKSLYTLHNAVENFAKSREFLSHTFFEEFQLEKQKKNVNFRSEIICSEGLRGLTYNCSRLRAYNGRLSVRITLKNGD